MGRRGNWNPGFCVSGKVYWRGGAWTSFGERIEAWWLNISKRDSFKEVYAQLHSSGTRGNLVVSSFAVVTTFLSCSCCSGGLFGLILGWILLICHLSGILMEALKT
jgi:hypothetical protein